MAYFPVILSFWAFCTVAFVALVIYRGHLTRHEVGMVFLDDSVTQHNEREHNEIVRRVNRIRPFMQTAGGAVALCTVLMVGVYVASVLPYVKL
jgi:hypothetical protein